MWVQSQLLTWRFEFHFLFSCSVLSDSSYSMDCSTPGFSVFHHLLELAQTHVHWVGDAMQPSDPLSSVPFYSCFQSFPVSGSLPVSVLFASGGQRIGAWASASLFPMNIQGLISFRLTGLISLLSKGFSRVFSSTTVRRHQFFPSQPFLLSSFCWHHSFSVTLKSHCLGSVGDILVGFWEFCCRHHYPSLWL